MDRVLVTGGAGFVGSHACKALRRAGYLPIVYDNLERGSADFVRWGPLEQGDICDADRLSGAMKTHNVKAVLHFAALAYVQESFTRPDAYVRTNVLGALCVLDAMTQAGVRDIVFSSSCAVYGAPAGGVCVEDMPQNPVNPYGASKAAAEQAIRLHSLAHNLSWTSLRYFNAAGADPDGETGERHDPETHIIPLAILAALEERPLNIFGSGCATRDGSAERDFVHVSDLADAHVLALDRLRNGGESRPMNLCAGQGVTILEICDAVERVLRKPIHRISAPARKGDPDRLVGDSSVAAAALGWIPARSSLPQLVRDAAAWLQTDRSRATPLQTPALAL